MLRKKRTFLPFLLIAALLAVSIRPDFVFAVSSNDSPAITSDVVFQDGAIEENISVEIGGKNISIQRLTYENDISITTITEDGITTSFSQTMDYDRLLANLKETNIPITRGDRLEGYEYVYFTSFTQESYATPENATWSALFSVVSLALGSFGIPGSSITAIVSLLYGLGASAVETKFVMVRDWYIVNFKDSGEFVGYYRCEYTLTTYVKDGTGRWVNIDTQYGNFDGTQVY